MKIKTIEAGYAKVYDERGLLLGSVSETKAWSSTRTGTTWEAFTPGGTRIANELTRADAAAKIVKWHEERNAKREARLARERS